MPRQVFTTLSHLYLWRMAESLLTQVVEVTDHPRSFFALTFMFTFVLSIRCGRSVQKWVPSLSGIQIAYLCLVGLIAAIGCSQFGMLGWEAALGLRILSVMAIGSFFGNRIEHSTHIAPLLVVASIVDLISVAARGSFTNAVIESVEGGSFSGSGMLVYNATSAGFMPLFGLADLCFSMILISAANRLNLPKVRLSIGIYLGAAVGLVTLIITAKPLPLLPFISVFSALALRASIQTDRKSVWQSAIFIVVFVALMLCVYQFSSLESS